MKIVGWTSFDSECQGICVGEKKTMVDALNETLRVIREEGYVFSGESHQMKSCCVPVFDNGKCLRSSMRGWAMLMSLAHTNSDASYMDYYMDQFVSDEKLPEREAAEDLFVMDSTVDGFPYYCSNQDLQLVTESVSMGMPLMTLDPAVSALYDIIKEQSEAEE